MKNSKRSTSAYWSARTWRLVMTKRAIHIPEGGDDCATDTISVKIIGGLKNALIAILLWAGSFVTIQLRAQSISVEAMAGTKNYFYQHSFVLPLPASKLSLFHASSMHLLYDETTKNEVMTQSYLTFRVASFMRLALGTFYASKPGISPSLAAQFHISSRHLKALLVPRIDLKKKGSAEAMALVEYMPSITEHTSFYLRVQLMSNYGSQIHNRSYQNIRVGLKKQKTTGGLALNVDERGPEKQTQHNWGVFLRYDW